MHEVHDGVDQRDSSSRDERSAEARARHPYLVLRRREVSVCAVNPGFPEELHLRADRRTLTGS